MSFRNYSSNSWSDPRAALAKYFKAVLIIIKTRLIPPVPMEEHQPSSVPDILLEQLLDQLDSLSFQ